MIKKILIISVIIGFLLSSFSFSRATVKSEEKVLVFSIAQVPIEAPKTLEEAGGMAEKALETAKKELPGTLERVWKERVLPIWQRMHNWFIVNIWSRIEGWFQKEAAPTVKEEIGKRKPIIEEELKKEKEQIKEELLRIGKSLWEFLSFF